ncbi:hypothetical protein EV361DRAFT_865798 [Lentinula raphanica]|nr:hypothetical protein EV361DRAFT_865798 [Lentinula raphanica]
MPQGPRSHSTPPSSSASPSTFGTGKPVSMDSLCSASAKTTPTWLSADNRHLERVEEEESDGDSSSPPPSSASPSGTTTPDSVGGLNAGEPPVRSPGFSYIAHSGSRLEQVTMRSLPALLWPQLLAPLPVVATQVFCIGLSRLLMTSLLLSCPLADHPLVVTTPLGRSPLLGVGLPIVDTMPRALQRIGLTLDLRARLLLLIVGGYILARVRLIAVATDGITPLPVPGLVTTVLPAALGTTRPMVTASLTTTKTTHLQARNVAGVTTVQITLRFPRLETLCRCPSQIMQSPLSRPAAPPLVLTATADRAPTSLTLVAPSLAAIVVIQIIADTILADDPGLHPLANTTTALGRVVEGVLVIENSPTLVCVGGPVGVLVLHDAVLCYQIPMDVLPEVAAALRNGWSGHIAMGWFNPALALRAKWRSDGSEHRSVKNLCAYDLSRISSEDFTEIAKAMPLAVEAYLIPAKESAPGSGQALRMADSIRKTFAMVISQRNFRDQFPTWQEYTQDVLYEWYLHPGQGGSPFVLDYSRYRILWERAFRSPFAVVPSSSSSSSASHLVSAGSLSSGSRPSKPRSSGYHSVAPSAVDDGCFLCTESSHTTRGHVLKSSDLLKCSSDNRNWVDREGNIICNAFNHRVGCQRIPCKYRHFCGCCGSSAHGSQHYHP